jgi:hypothetical protein
MPKKQQKLWHKNHPYKNCCVISHDFFKKIKFYIFLKMERYLPIEKKILLKLLKPDLNLKIKAIRDLLSLLYRFQNVKIDKGYLMINVDSNDIDLIENALYYKFQLYDRSSLTRRYYLHDFLDYMKDKILKGGYPWQYDLEESHEKISHLEQNRINYQKVIIKNSDRKIKGKITYSNILPFIKNNNFQITEENDILIIQNL